VKHAAQIKRETSAIRTWGVRAGIAFAVVFLAASGWEDLRADASFDRLPLLIVQGSLIFGLVFAFAWIMSVVHQRIERIPDGGSDET
jgi:hypothetical protein